MLTHPNLAIITGARASGKTTAALNLAINSAAGNHQKNVLYVCMSSSQADVHLQIAENIAAQRSLKTAKLWAGLLRLCFDPGGAIHFLYMGAEDRLKGMAFDECFVDTHPAVPDLLPIILCLPTITAASNARRIISSRP